MSHPNSGAICFQIDPSYSSIGLRNINGSPSHRHIDQNNSSGSSSFDSRYLTPPTNDPLLGTPDSSIASPVQGARSSSIKDQDMNVSSAYSSSTVTSISMTASGSKAVSSRRNRNSVLLNDGIKHNAEVTRSDTKTASASGRLRPQRSLVMKHRLRKLNDFYEEQQDQPQQHGQASSGSHHSPVSKPLPLLPHSAGRSSPSSSSEALPKRRGVSLSRGLSSRRRDPLGSLVSRSANSSSNPEEIDTSRLLEYSQEISSDPLSSRCDRAGYESYELQPTSLRQEFSTIDLNGNREKKRCNSHGLTSEYYNSTQEHCSDNDQHHRHTWTEMLHGDRPDRHLFPYRSSKENIHALKTFLRRFYLVLLIIPAWTIPYVLTAQAEHAQLKQEHLLERAAPEVEEKGAGGGEHGVMLSKWANLIVFILNLLAMMHLGKAAGACMEELVPKLGMRIVSIFDAMTSSSVELAVAAFALMKGLVRVVQAAMLGAILNNLLMMMGIALCVGGYYHREQKIQADTSQTGMNLLMIVCISYVIPVALDSTFTELRKASIPHHLSQAQLIEATRAITEGVQHDLWTISKVMAIVMLILYGCCLLFQYDSTSFMVTPEAKHTGAHTVHRRNVHYWFAGLGYSVMLGAQIYSANLLVHAVEALGKQFHLNDSFVGFVLLPIVLIADLQEEVIAIKESRANRLDRSIALMVGSCMQIALLVTPLLVLLGWVVDVPMTFRFSLLEAAVLAGSVLIVNYLLQDNETNWLEGCLLLAAFFMCALAFYYDIKPFESELGSGDHEPGAGSHH
ncbi:hypothetical protein BX616_007454 [Lobosporangium transversale]|nr:hypothetical protein BX616_007454 [Lobosporangium transversale]